MSIVLVLHFFRFILVSIWFVFLGMYVVFNRNQMNIFGLAYYHRYYFDIDSSILIGYCVHDRSIPKVQVNEID